MAPLLEVVESEIEIAWPKIWFLPAVSSKRIVIALGAEVKSYPLGFVASCKAEISAESMIIVTLMR